MAAFSGQCNLRFLSTKVLQRSVTTCVNYGRIFIDSFTANLLQSVMVKEIGKSVSISQLQAKIKWHLIFRTLCININKQRMACDAQLAAQLYKHYV